MISNAGISRCLYLKSDIYVHTRISRYFFSINFFTKQPHTNQAKSRKILFNRPSFPIENQSRKLRNYPQVKLFGHVFVFRASNKIKGNSTGTEISYQISPKIPGTIWEIDY
jgi:hypothetical protein